MARAPQHRAEATAATVTERRTIYLTAEQHQKLRLLAAQENCTMSELIARWIEEHGTTHYIETGGRR